MHATPVWSQSLIEERDSRSLLVKEIELAFHTLETLEGEPYVHHMSLTNGVWVRLEIRMAKGEGGPTIFFLKETERGAIAPSERTFEEMWPLGSGAATEGHPMMMIFGVWPVYTLYPTENGKKKLYKSTTKSRWIGLYPKIGLCASWVCKFDFSKNPYFSSSELRFGDTRTTFELQPLSEAECKDILSAGLFHRGRFQGEPKTRAFGQHQKKS